jgi:hypothetical protein
MKIYALTVFTVFLAFGTVSFAQTIEEKNLALAKNYMIKNNLESEFVQIDLVNPIDENKWSTLKSKILGLESIYHITLKEDNKTVVIKSYMVDNNTVERKIKNSIETIVGNQVVFSYHTFETIEQEKL